MPSASGRSSALLPAAALVVLAAVCVRAVASAAGAPEQLVEEGRALAGALGCGGCHPGVEAPGPARGAAPRLGPGGDPLPAAFVFAYLDDPQPRRPDIAPARMPRFDLSAAERVALALYLGRARDTGDGSEAFERGRAGAPAADAAEGRRLFGALGCGGCHENADAPASAPAPDLSVEGARVTRAWLEGYLARPVPIRPAGEPIGSGSRMPDFRLAPAEVQALAAYLTGDVPTAGSAPAPEPLTPGRARRAEWLLHERAACLGCHRLDGEGGRLGPPLDGISARLRPEWVRRMIADPSGALPGGSMPAQPLSAADQELLAHHLLADRAPWSPAERVELPAPAATASPPQREAAASDVPAGAPDGAALYARWCAACHGPAGEGDGWNASALPVAPTRHADAGAMAARADDTLYDAIHAGGWVLEASSLMPAFGARLTPAEVEALVAHIRRLCACRGPAWSRDGSGGSGGSGGFGG